MRIINFLNLVASGLCVAFPCLALQFPLLPPQSLSDHPPLLDAEFDRFVENVLKAWNSPGGLAVSLVRLTPNSTRSAWKIESKGYGVENADGTRMSPDSLFCIASNSKIFTAIATGLLVSNQSLSPAVDWNSKMVSLVPRWKLLDPIATSNANLIDLMSHRTGLPRHDFFYGRHTSAAAVVSSLKFLRPSAAFRETWQYNNNMYTSLAMIPEVHPQIQMPLATYVQKNLFDRLRMNSTTYSYTRAKASGRLADGFGRDARNRTRDVLDVGVPRSMLYPGWDLPDANNFKAGAGGVISSANDATIWLRTLLMGGRDPTCNESIIPSEVLEKITTGFTVMQGRSRYPELSPSVYGGGQVRLSYRGQEIIEHSGATNGYHSSISRFATGDLGVAVFSNDDSYGHQLAEIVKYRIFDAVLLGRNFVDWNARFQSEVTEAYRLAQSKRISRPKNARRTSVEPVKLTGRYRNLAYGMVELCLVGAPDGNRNCEELFEETTIRLPGILTHDLANGSNGPSYLARYDSFWVTHLLLTHFDGNVFNLTLLDSRPTVRSPGKAYWVADLSEDSVYSSQFDIAKGKGSAVRGFSWDGDIWGQGPDVFAPKCGNIEERSEVWFEKV